MEIELSKETRLETESQLKERMAKFQDTSGVNMSSDEQKETAHAKASHLSLDNAQFAQISDFVKGMEGDLSHMNSIAIDMEAPTKRMPRISRDEALARLAQVKLEQLQNRLSAEHPIFKAITYEDLVRSVSLRALVLDYDLTLFRQDPKPIGSFKREYSNARDAEVALEQSNRQSSLHKIVSEREDISLHNQQMQQEYREEERGLEDTNKIDKETLKLQIKDEIALLRQTQPEKASEMDKFIFGTKSDIDEALAVVIPEEEIKYYPGSIKGPEPEDDPETWAQWYYEHQPPSAFKDGKINAADLGVRYKFLKPKEDQQTTGQSVQNIIYQRTTDAFFNTDELYPDEHKFDGRPEFTLMKKTNFNVPENQRPPELMFLSPQGPNELAPIQPDAPYAYQDIHEGLEKWTLFRMLPQILKYDREWTEWMSNV